MRIREAAAVIGVEPGVLAEEIKGINGDGVTPTPNRSLSDAEASILSGKYPALATALQAEAAAPPAPEAVAEAPAPQATPAPVAPAPAPVASVPVAPVAPAPPAPPQVSTPENIVPQSDKPEDNTAPQARAEVSKTAVQRQLENGPAKATRKFKVEYPGAETAVIEAIDENEAWAKFNDARGAWPGPRLRTVTEVS